MAFDFRKEHKEFKKIALSMPFHGFLCKISQKPLEKMLSRVKVPGNISVRDFRISGYRDEIINVKEIIPQPCEEKECGAILVLHGGGFGYKMAPYQLMNAFRYAAGTGCKVYIPDYHLIPDYPFPAAYEDSMRTYCYMAEHSEELGIDPHRITVLGDSAGGALAANVCNMAAAEGLPMPCCQVLIYPVIDSTMITESMKKFTDTPMWNSKNNRRMWEMYLKNVTSEDMSIAVPMGNLLPESLPPTYIETAEFDCLHDEAISYAERIRDIAAVVEVHETKGTVHGYDMLQEHPVSQESMRRRIEFMKKCKEDQL